MASNLQLHINKFQYDDEFDETTCRMTLMEAREMEVATQFMGYEFEPEEESDTELYRSSSTDLSATSSESPHRLSSQTRVEVDRSLKFEHKWDQVIDREELETCYSVYTESLWAEERTLAADDERYDEDNEDGESDSEDSESNLPDLIDLSCIYEGANDAVYHRCDGHGVCTGCVHCHPYTYFDETF